MKMFIDIDGTLTDLPGKRWGNPKTDMIDKVKMLIETGHKIIMWSAGGRRYAKAFSQKYGIKAAGYVAKPDIMVDDKPSIRSRGIPVVSPEDFLQRNFVKK